MATYYIARLKDGGLAAMYTGALGLSARFFTEGRWGEEQIFLKGAEGDFTAGFDDGGNLCVFGRDGDGDITLTAFRGHDYRSRKLLSGQSVKPYPMSVYSMKNSTLLYNIPADDKGRVPANAGIDAKTASPANAAHKFKLVQHSPGGSEWQEPVEVAELSPYPAIDGPLFDLQLLNTERSHGIVLYNDSRNLMGYREISLSRVCDFVPLSRPGELVLDYSLLTIAEGERGGIHVLYVSAALFTKRLLYVKKTSAKLSEPVILWEGPRIENCLLKEIDGEIWALWSVGENLFVAKTKGSGFEKAAVYTQKFCKRPVKARYISAYTSGDETYRAKTVYVDGQKPWDVQIMPDAADGFYPQAKPAATLTLEPPEPPEPPAKPEDTDERLGFAIKQLGKLKEENQKLRDEVQKLRKPPVS